ncbi:saccharopine dehydrogenase NADP-binding domain-containing protein [Maritalea myrionectae]|uniref:saccharopine dehydrogenase NADP-binding domain-containing protein n=1 Tax=Maritalea myrionectae TaxID=454601 RepID=UPI00041FA73C|nr:saccharopine dehydrogenase NADP-binding domain-containing protein [Maritalea myrionectae]
MTRYWIIGGYGDVGSAVAQSLITTLAAGDELFIAGRNLGKAEALAGELGDQAKAIELNVNGPVVAGQFQPGDVVVNTVETISDEWLSALAQTGLSFIDVSATEDYLNRVRGLFGQYGQNSLCITEVGASPGLTNLMAAKLAEQEAQVDRIHTFIEMGMGEHHGYAATKWFFEALASPYPVLIDGAQKVLSPRDQLMSVEYKLPKTRQATAIGVGFSDQISIANRHNLHAAQTFVGVAPNWMNNVLGQLVRLPFSTVLRRHSGFLAGMMSKFPPVGPVRTSIRSVAYDSEQQILGSIEMLGGDQSELTAEIAAMGARAADVQKQTGVISLPDILDLDQVKQQLPRLTWR